MRDTSLERFLFLMRELFKEHNRGLINENTDLQELEEWSSLQIMIIVSEIDREYDVLISADEMRGITTIAKLYDLVKKKTN